MKIVVHVARSLVIMAVDSSVPGVQSRQMSGEYRTDMAT